ncbi:MAG: hypothetical protein JWP47_1119 [Polaromonas sp.]|nr:hypothetical protein [Polaromonas sp.]
MSDSDNPSFAGFGKFVPGFDFLQNLATQAAGSAAQKIPQLPNLGNWVAPTLNVEELDKRIDELKAVQFWLDQNAMALKATIQALEVQKMTLATLKGMNFSMGDVANAFKLKVSDSLAGGVQKAAEKARTFSGFEIPPSTFQAQQDTAAPDDKQADADASGDEEAAPEEAPAKGAGRAEPASKLSKSAKPAAAGGVVDPLQWWGALTQQFQAIAADAMKDAAKKAALETGKSMATGMAKDALKSASSMATGLARGMASSAGKTVADGTRAAMNSALRSTQAWPVPTAKTPTSGSAKAAPARKAAGKSAAQRDARTAGRTPAKSAAKAARKTSR